MQCILTICRRSYSVFGCCVAWQTTWCSVCNRWRTMWACVHSIYTSFFFAVHSSYYSFVFLYLTVIIAFAWSMLNWLHWHYDFYAWKELNRFRNSKDRYYFIFFLTWDDNDDDEVVSLRCQKFYSIIKYVSNEFSNCVRQFIYLFRLEMKWKMLILLKFFRIENGCFVSCQCCFVCQHIHAFYRFFLLIEITFLFKFIIYSECFFPVSLIRV